MDNALIILTAILVLVTLALIALYNRFDRMRFRLERMLHGVREPIGDWVRACAALRGGDDGGYFKCKRPADKTACLRRLIAETQGNSAEKLDLQGELLEFCGRFNFLADDFDRKLSAKPFGPIAQRLGFRPIGRIDFYPDIKQ